MIGLELTEDSRRFATARRWLQEVGQRVGGMARGVLLDTRQQLLLVVLVSVMVFAIASRDVYGISLARILVKDVMVQFFSALAQAIAALLGLLIAFLLFAMERIDDRIGVAQSTFNSEVRDLVRLAMDRPEELSDLEGDLDRIMALAVHYAPGDLSVGARREEWRQKFASFERTAEEYQYHPLTTEARQYCHLMVLTVKNIRQAVSAVGVQYVATVVAGLLVHSITKLSALLAISLALILFFGAVNADSPGFVDDLARFDLVIVSALLVFVALALGEIIVHISILHHELKRKLWS